MFLHMEFIWIVLLFVCAQIADGIIRTYGRRVCPTTKMVTKVVPMEQTYRKPYYPRCNTRTSSCTNRTVYYKTAVRTVFYKRLVPDTYNACCPGWRQTRPWSPGCLEPVCSDGCQNGGTCIGPEKCACTMQFTGARCEIDVDECLMRTHTCQHLCKNTYGNYECTCYEGFRLTDGRNCEFCPICIPAFESLMNKVNDLQTTITKMEKEKNDLVVNMSLLEGRYIQTTNMVDELRRVTMGTPPTPVPPTTTTDVPLTDIFGMPYKFDRIDSISEQLGMLEERLDDCSCKENNNNDRYWRNGYRNGNRNRRHRQ